MSFGVRNKRRKSRSNIFIFRTKYASKNFDSGPNILLMDGRISFHKLTITISASEAQKRLFSFEKFLIICPTTVHKEYLLFLSVRIPYNEVTCHDVGWLATVLKRVKTLHFKNYFYIKMIDPTWISPYLTKNSPKVDILINFRAVAIHPTLWRVTPLYGIVLYSINLDVFSIAIEFLTTNDLDSWRWPLGAKVH